MAQEADVRLVQEVLKAGKIANSHEFAKAAGLDHQAVVGALASLGSEDAQVLVKSAPIKAAIYSLSAAGKEFLTAPLPEAQVLAVLQANGPQSKDELMKALPKAATDGIKFGMKERILALDKATQKFNLAPAAEGWTSPTLKDLQAIQDGKGDKDIAKRLSARKFCETLNISYFAAEKGANFPASEAEVAEKPWRVKKAADFTAEQLQEMWASDELLPMKKPNLNAAGTMGMHGNMHPLMKLRQLYREIFLELGFEEMDTARFVDSSFWNFDTLFVPQKHPARDAQDTFFVVDPEKTTDHPKEYVELTKEVHGEGLYGSRGYRYQWDENEAQRNVLRTHTTAISSYTLYEIGQEYQRTGKLKTGAFFSIDRVFRNETMDKTHLCEFHQMEGFVLDYDLSLSNMMGVLKAFFERVGVENLMFKPAYNPYTEPSMEIHTVQNGKIMEIGNSGVFRPEMLRPMGLPEGVTAIAWGLGLERVACRHYKLDSVHDLFGHRISLPFVKGAGAPRL
eukprot:TRINITY_DN21034_c0_g1_i1.p2 TRINITY_DN21034_c0_g1~~TRINITY_DN21034_c0_g1_i1.p2  ORF type:complete len:509 (+),score=236.81 TRINITY_DN21034_c0_g1_i1:145-1671(+)